MEGYSSVLERFRIRILDKAKDVLEIVVEVAESMRNNGLMLNERYLHHYFSYLVQKKFDSLNLAKNKEELALHPEWPTYKEQTDLHGFWLWSFGTHINTASSSISVRDIVKDSSSPFKLRQKLLGLIATDSLLRKCDRKRSSRPTSLLLRSSLVCRNHQDLRILSVVLPSLRVL